jgi:hypothetical protein
MESVITVIMIGIGVVLLLVFQGIVLASLNKGGEQPEHQPETWHRRSIMDIVKSIVSKRYVEKRRCKYEFRA